MAEAPRLWRQLQDLSRASGEGPLDIDLADVEVVDGAVMALLVQHRANLFAAGRRSELLGVSERLRPLVHLYRGDTPPEVVERPRRAGLLAGVGDVVHELLDHGRRLITFGGEFLDSILRLPRRASGVNWRAVPTLAERAGIDGVPIVMLLNFLVGFVMGFQSARQLMNYGANIFVADIVGISVTRELAPLMTAIIMSGRSGAAFAAELGTMRVSDEIDALRTMGFSPIPFLVLPRMVSLAIVAPVLTLIGDIMGVLGGAVVALGSLDVSLRGYFSEIQTAVLPSDVWTGLVKGVAFGVAIAFIACQQGFSTHGAAAGVGRSTTTTVVACLLTIVTVDTLFTVLFRVIGA